MFFETDRRSFILPAKSGCRPLQDAIARPYANREPSPEDIEDIYALANDLLPAISTLTM